MRKEIPEEWKEWNDILDRIGKKLNRQEWVLASLNNSWPYWVPEGWINIYRRLGLADLLMAQMLGEWPSFGEIKSRVIRI